MGEMLLGIGISTVFLAAFLSPLIVSIKVLREEDGDGEQGET